MGDVKACLGMSGLIRPCRGLSSDRLRFAGIILKGQNSTKGYALLIHKGGHYKVIQAAADPKRPRRSPVLMLQACEEAGQGERMTPGKKTVPGGEGLRQSFYSVVLLVLFAVQNAVHNGHDNQRQKG